MANEVVQWALLVILFILVLGVLRQVGLMLPAQMRGASTGPEVGQRLPNRLLTEVMRAAHSSHLLDGTTVAFITESCVGCQQLVANLDDGNGQRDQPLVLVARKASRQFQEALNGLGVPTVFDNGALWKASRVTATPLVVRLDEEGRVVSKEVTHRVDRVGEVGT